MIALLTNTEAAGLLKISPRTLAGWRRQDYGPPYARLGGQCRYDRNTLEEWVEAERENQTRARQFLRNA